MGADFKDQEPMLPATQPLDNRSSCVFRMRLRVLGSKKRVAVVALRSVKANASTIYSHKHLYEKGPAKSLSSHRTHPMTCL